jgi:catechol 2,3-dioxygenase-like lactoylglutathione lyase family enzyme
MLRIDHVVLAVPDLDEAAARLLDRYGLASVPGGVHPGWGTGNRIVPLGRDYVELIAVADPAIAASSPFGTLIGSLAAGGDRLFALCLSTDDVDAEADRLGLEAAEGSRLRPDGLTLSWRSAGLEVTMRDRSLPFFIQWRDPDRHPGLARAEHRSGPGGIAWVEVAGDEAAVRRWIGGGSPPIRFVEPNGEPGPVAVGLAAAGGEIVLRPGS